MRYFIWNNRRRMFVPTERKIYEDLSEIATRFVQEEAGDVTIHVGPIWAELVRGGVVIFATTKQGDYLRRLHAEAEKRGNRVSAVITRL